MLGLNRFKLIVRENLRETQPLVIRMAREAHVLVQDHRLVRVQINDLREKLFYFSNLLDEEYAEWAGQASLRIVTYDYDGGLSDKSLVFNDSVQYMDTTFDFEEHFRRALTQMGVLRDDWDPLLRRYSAFNTAIRGDSAADPAEFFDLEYLGRSFGVNRAEVIIIERVTGLEGVSVVATLEASPPRARSSVVASAWAVSAA